MSLNYEISPLSKIDDRLAHLTQEQIHALIDDYMGEKPVDEILIDYNLKEKIKVGLNKALPALQSDRKCAYCEQMAVWPIPARYIAKKHLGDPICIECNHICKELEVDPLEDKNCTCINCEEIRQRDALALAKDTKSVLNNLHEFARVSPVKIEELSFVHTLTLYSLCRIEENKKSNMVLPVSNEPYQASLTPTKSLTKKLLQELFDLNVISISPESNPDAFEHSPIFSIKNITEITWILNILGADEEHVSVEDGQALLYKKLSKPFSSNEIEVTKQFVIDLAIDEIMEYALWLENGYGNNFPLCKSLRIVLTNLLVDHPVSELYDFVAELLSVTSKRDNDDWILQESDGSAESFLEPFIQRIASNKWKLKNHDREFYRSWLSESLYENLLLSNDIGFTQNIESLWKKKLLPRFQ